MRATRAYIAGAGTTGSLLAGAAIVFVLASALVAFHGWPDIATPGSAAPLVVSSPQAAGGSATSQRVAAATAVAVGQATTATANARGGAGSGSSAGTGGAGNPG